MRISDWSSDVCSSDLEVLAPMHMTRSGFEEPSASESVASGHVADGTMVPGGWHVYPELAAASLWSTASDLASFGLAAMEAVRDEPNALLSPALASIDRKSTRLNSSH